MSKKDEIIANIYNNFYGSIRSTYEDAKKKDPSIKYEDVKLFFDKNFVRKQNLKGYNSYIADYPNQEYQIDLFFMPEEYGEEYKIGLLVIDIFTKFINVVPLKTKQSDEVLDAIKKAFRSMGKPPEMIYSDDEFAFHSPEAEAYYKENLIKHIITRGHASYGERAIRTIKAMMHKRMEINSEFNWYDPDILSNALVNYNYKMKNSVTGMTPSEAKNPRNIFEVKANLEIHRISKRKYPDIAVDDEVRIYKKKKNFAKERTGIWSENKYKVEMIEHSHGQNFYHVSGHDKPLLRHEVLKA